MLSPEKIIIELSNKEAFILFEFLHRSNDEANYRLVDQAEQRVLWNVEALLEKQLVEIFTSDYHKLLAEAREQVRDPLI